MDLFLPPDHRGSVLIWILAEFISLFPCVVFAMHGVGKWQTASR